MKARSNISKSYYKSDHMMSQSEKVLCMTKQLALIMIKNTLGIYVMFRIQQVKYFSMIFFKSIIVASIQCDCTCFIVQSTFMFFGYITKFLFVLFILIVEYNLINFLYELQSQLFKNWYKIYDVINLMIALTPLPPSIPPFHRPLVLFISCYVSQMISNSVTLGLTMKEISCVPQWVGIILQNKYPTCPDVVANVSKPFRDKFFNLLKVNCSQIKIIFLTINSLFRFNLRLYITEFCTLLSIVQFSWMMI